MHSKVYSSVTIIIATLDRVSDLRRTLVDWRAGSFLPAEVRVVDASDNELSWQLCGEDWSPLRVTYRHSPVKSAAQQRNLGADGCQTEYLLFCDDDVEVEKDTLIKLLTVFEGDKEKQIGGIAGTIKGYHHVPPSRLLRWYYRVQAGYDHETYGGRFFGPSINILPTDRAEDPELYPSQWLNSTLVMYRTEVFAREHFPKFTGYSFQEDVNLSARIGRTHALYFHRGVRYIHKSAPGSHKSNPRLLAEREFINRWYNAREILGLDGWELWFRFMLSQVINSVLILRDHRASWKDNLLGGWSAWWRLAIAGHDVRKVLKETSE